MYSMIVYLNDCCAPGPGDGGTRFYSDAAKGHLVAVPASISPLLAAVAHAANASAASAYDANNALAAPGSGDPVNENLSASVPQTNGGATSTSGALLAGALADPAAAAVGREGTASLTPRAPAAPQATRWSADPALEVCCVAAVRGRCLVFYHNHVHEGTAPALGAAKYIVRSDLMYRRRVAVCDSLQDRAAYRLYQQAVDLAGVAGQEANALPLFQKAFAMSRPLADLYGI
jgi:hypothetical protein